MFSNSDRPTSQAKPTDSKWLPYVLIALTWALTRAFPLSQAIPWTYWDVWEAKKLLDYGFGNRLGAIIDIHYMAGLVPNPWQFNYVNHPYPILWANTFFYYLGGPWATLLFNSAIGLAGCLIAYSALRYFYSEKESLGGSLLFTVVPINVLFNVNPDLSGVAASFWPFTIWAIAAARANPSKGRLWLVGIIIFLSGQVSWSTYSFYPLLIVGAMGLTWERGNGFRWEPNLPVLRAVLCGILLTGLVFLAQILFYTPDWSELTAYIGRQAGSEQGLSPARMYLAILLRSALSVGPALLVGSLAFVALRPRLRRLDWLRLSALLYPLLFACFALILRRYFYRERHLYCYLAFPLVVIVLETMRSFRSALWSRTIAAFAVAGLSYPLIQATIPVASATSRELGRELGTLTTPQQVVATNLLPQQFPFAAWDVGSMEIMTLAADRNLRYGVKNRAGLDALLANFKTQRLDVLYVLDPNRSVDDSLLSLLNQSHRATELRFPLPRERVSFAMHLRDFYWRLTGKQRPSHTSNEEQPIALRVTPLLLQEGREPEIAVSNVANGDERL